LGKDDINWGKKILAFNLRNLKIKKISVSSNQAIFLTGKITKNKKKIKIKIKI